MNRKEKIIPPESGDRADYVAGQAAHEAAGLQDGGAEYQHDREAPECGGQGDEHWPGVDKMLVAAYEHGLNSEPMDMIAMKARYAALAHPPAQASGAVTEAMVEAGGFAVATVRAEQTSGDKYSYWRKRKDDCRAIARAVLTAALAQGGGNER